VRNFVLRAADQLSCINFFVFRAAAETKASAREAYCTRIQIGPFASFFEAPIERTKKLCATLSAGDVIAGSSGSTAQHAPGRIAY
jgi:hypothetical protein